MTAHERKIYDIVCLHYNIKDFIIVGRNEKAQIYQHLKADILKREKRGEIANAFAIKMQTNPLFSLEYLKLRNKANIAVWGKEWRG